MASVSVSVPAAHPSAPEIPALLRGRLRWLHPLYRSFELWSDADGLRMSAAMSFYGILSLAPLLVLIVAVLGWWLDRELLETSLIAQIGALVGAQGAEIIKAAIDSAREPGQGVLASALAFVLLVVGATGVFAELQSAFERLWTQGTGTAAVDAWWHTATLRLRGIAYVLAFGFLMLVSTVISSLLGLLEAWAGDHIDMKLLLAGLNQLASFLITTALFVALMRMSAGPQPRLRHLLRGAAAGALLFGVGKYALALYLSTAAVVSAYGAAGSLVVLLMWIYFASAVLLYGASMARVMAEKHGEFAAEPTPPPAAAVTGLQAEVRDATGDVKASTAAAAALLSGGAPAGATAASADGLAHRRRSAGALGWLASRTASLTSRPELIVDGLALLFALAGALGLDRKKSAPARAARQAGSRPAAPEARHPPGVRLRTPRALRQWAGRATDSGAAQLAARWRHWRERRALVHARRMLARDVQALRDALRRP